MKPMLEQEAFHVLDSELPEDQWPELEIWNATISVKKSGREEAFIEDFRDLLQVNQCGPFRLEGQIVEVDERKPALKGMLKNRDVVNCRLIVPEIWSYSLERTWNRETGELESSTPIIWALGQCAWYKIIPHQDYQKIHNESIKQAKLWLHAEDFYLDEDSANGFVGDLFDYYRDENSDCEFSMQAKGLFKKYRRFIMVKMVDDEYIKGQRQWSHTPLFTFYQDEYSSELRQIKELLKKRRIDIEKKNATKTPAKRKTKATPKASTSKRQRKSTTSTAAASTKSTRASANKSRTRSSEVIDLTEGCIVIKKDNEYESEDTSTKRPTRLRQASQSSTDPKPNPSTSHQALKQAQLPFTPITATATLTPKATKPVPQLASFTSTTSTVGSSSKLDLFLDYTQPRSPHCKPSLRMASTPASPPKTFIQERLADLKAYLDPPAFTTEPMDQKSTAPTGSDAGRAMTPPICLTKRQAEEPLEDLNAPDKKSKVDHAADEETSFHTPPQSPVGTPFQTPSETPIPSSDKKPLWGNIYPPCKPVTSGFLVIKRTPNTCPFPTVQNTWFCEPCNFIIYDADCSEGKKLIDGHIKEHKEHNAELLKAVDAVKLEAEAREFEGDMGYVSLFPYLIMYC